MPVESFTAVNPSRLNVRIYDFVVLRSRWRPFNGCEPKDFGKMESSTTMLDRTMYPRPPQRSVWWLWTIVFDYHVRRSDFRNSWWDFVLALYLPVSFQFRESVRLKLFSGRWWWWICLIDYATLSRSKQWELPVASMMFRGVAAVERQMQQSMTSFVLKFHISSNGRGPWSNVLPGNGPILDSGDSATRWCNWTTGYANVPSRLIAGALGSQSAYIFNTLWWSEWSESTVLIPDSIWGQHVACIRQLFPGTLQPFQHTAPKSLLRVFHFKLRQLSSTLKTTVFDSNFRTASPWMLAIHRDWRTQQGRRVCQYFPSKSIQLNRDVSDLPCHLVRSRLIQTHVGASVLDSAISVHNIDDLMLTKSMQGPTERISSVL
jgi:hypothetical protein